MNKWYVYRKKIAISIFLCLVLALNISNNLINAGTNDPKQSSNLLGLDYKFMWNITENISHVVHNNSIWGDSIIKGRAFATEGDRWTADYINNTMNYRLKISSNKIPLLPIKEKQSWMYTNKVETIDYQLEINHPDYTKNPYNLPSKVPKNETFVFPSAIDPNFNHSFDNVRVVPYDDIPKNFFGESYDIYCDVGDSEFGIFGYASYISVNESIPDEQETKVFLIDEVPGFEKKLDN